MSDLRKAAEALIKHWEAGEFQNCTGDMAGHIRLLRQALAQPEQKPVAWMYLEPNNPYKTVHIDDYDYAQMRQDDEWFPVYIAPPKKEWVGLTDQEVDALLWKLSLGAVDEDVRLIEAKLKEKNSGDQSI